MMMMIDNIDNSNSTKIKDRNYSDKLIQLRVREIILELIFLFRGIKNQTSNIILFGNGSNVYYYSFSNGPRSNQIMSGVWLGFCRLSPDLHKTFAKMVRFLMMMMIMPYFIFKENLSRGGLWPDCGHCAGLHILLLPHLWVLVSSNNNIKYITIYIYILYIWQYINQMKNEN